MYLGLLTEENQKNLFMRLACLTSVADVASDETHESPASAMSSWQRAVTGDAGGEAFAESFRRKASETAVLQLFAKEMELEDFSDYEVRRLSDEVNQVILKVSGTTNPKLLSRESLRQEFLADAVKEVIADSDAELTTAQKKVILIEAAGMAYADDECSEVERFVLDTIAACFGIDSAFISDAADMVVKFKRVTDEGLELINE